MAELLGLEPYLRQRAATLGTIEVSGPVVFAVMTTVVAFLPIAFVEGMMGKFMYNIPVVVIAIRDDSYEKIVGNVQEVRARDGKIIFIVTEGDTAIVGWNLLVQVNNEAILLQEG